MCTCSWMGEDTEEVLGSFLKLLGLGFEQSAMWDPATFSTTPQAGQNPTFLKDCVRREHCT